MSQLHPEVNHRISLEKAKEMTSRYKMKRKEVLRPEFADKNILINSETFNREAIDSVLAQKSCVAIRIYFGMDENSSLRAIIVGVNANNQDILPQSMVTPTPTASISTTDPTSTDTTTDDGIIVEDGVVCPPNCPTDPTLP